MPAANLVGAEGTGIRQIMQHFVSERLCLAIEAYATAQRCLTLAIRWASTRQTFGTRLADKPVIRHKLAEMARQTDVAREYARAVARRFAAGEDVSREAAMAKNTAVYACAPVLALRCRANLHAARARAFTRRFAVAFLGTGRHRPPSNDLHSCRAPKRRSDWCRRALGTANSPSFLLRLREHNRPRLRVALTGSRAMLKDIQVEIAHQSVYACRVTLPEKVLQILKGPDRLEALCCRHIHHDHLVASRQVDDVVYRALALAVAEHGGGPHPSDHFQGMNLCIRDSAKLRNGTPSS